MTEEDFLAAINMTENCWLWTGCRQNKGYGVLRYQKKYWLAHRLAWKLFFGNLDPKLLVCHTCDNRICLRPSHLFHDRAKANTQDMLSKGREARGEKNGQAKLKEEDIRQIRKLCSEGNLHRDIAKRFKTGKKNISKIVNRLRWKHVE